MLLQLLELTDCGEHSVKGYTHSLKVPPDGTADEQSIEMKKPPA